MINKKNNKCPYEICNGNTPYVSYFNVFGCKCFINNNDKIHLSTFDDKLDADVLLGYSIVRKDDRVYNNRTLFVEEYVHVVFDESLFQGVENSNMHDLINRLYATKLDTNNYGEIDLIRIAELAPEIISSGLEENTVNKTSDEVELENDHQPDIPQDEHDANTNEDQSNQHQDLACLDLVSSEIRIIRSS